MSFGIDAIAQQGLKVGRIVMNQIDEIWGQAEDSFDDDETYCAKGSKMCDMMLVGLLHCFYKKHDLADWAENDDGLRYMSLNALARHLGRDLMPKLEDFQSFSYGHKECDTLSKLVTSVMVKCGSSVKGLELSDYVR